jgi:hypothetical protein
MRREHKQTKTPFIDSYRLILSLNQHDFLKRLAKSHNLSLRNLIMRAVHNEVLRAEEGFKFDFVETADTPYEEVRDFKGAQSLYNYIRMYPGLSIEDLCYLKNDISDITGERHLMVCFWHLLDNKMIVEKKAGELAFRGYTAYIVNPYGKAEGVL